MYQPRHFIVQELVPPSVYDRLGDRALILVDERSVITLDVLRDNLGKCIVNDWCFGGHFEQSGLRTDECPEFSPTSQHTFGRAMDSKFEKYSASEVRKFVIDNKELFPFITFIEDDVSWFHFDVRNCERITLWSPNTNEAKLV